jgi:alanyl-tRNA synthetase
MRQFTSDELRKAWKQFYIDRGHVDVGAVSLVSDGSTGVMFNVAGMQPLTPTIFRNFLRLISSLSLFSITFFYT